MKKNVAVALLLVCACAGLLVLGGCREKPDPNYLRIHIRADSDAVVDQDIKYVVKAAVVDYLTPKLVDCDTKAKATAAVRNNLDNLKIIADNVLIENGFEYASSVSLRQEEFPQRTYDKLTLEAGVYDALIIELGTASGQNWWCVVYPPLCFVNYEGTGTNGVEYRSKLLEIINSFFKK